MASLITQPCDVMCNFFTPALASSIKRDYVPQTCLLGSLSIEAIVGPYSKENSAAASQLSNTLASFTGLRLMPAISALYALNEVMLLSMSVHFLSSVGVRFDSIDFDKLDMKLSIPQLPETAPPTRQQFTFPQAALVEQPDGQANQLALCYTSEAAEAANAVNPDKELSMVVTVALTGAWIVLSCTGIWPWGVMCLVAVKKHSRRRRRRRQQEEERRCSQDTADISKPCATSQDARRSMQPKEQATVAQTQPSSRLSRWLRKLCGSCPQPQGKPAELPTEVQRWLQEAAEPCAPRRACRGAEDISKGRSEAQRWLDEAGFPPLPAAAAPRQPVAPKCAAGEVCAAAAEPLCCEADRWLGEIGEGLLPEQGVSPVTVVKELCSKSFCGETSPCLVGGRAGSKQRRFFDLFWR